MATTIDSHLTCRDINDVCNPCIQKLIKAFEIMNKEFPELGAIEPCK